MHFELFLSFCVNVKLDIAINMLDCKYNFNAKDFIIQDHFMLSGFLFNMAPFSYSVLHDGENLLDHDPIFLTIRFNYEKMNYTDRIHSEKFA